MDPRAVKEPLNGMLRCSGLSHKLPEGITTRAEDEPSIGGPSLARLVPVILDRSGIFENTNIFAFLCSSLNLFPDKNKGRHCLNGATQQEPSCIGIAAFSIRRERFVLEGLSVYGRPEGGTFADGVTRVGFSDACVAGRNYAMQLMRGFGMEPRVDPAGNIFGSRAGSDQSLKPILFGSHIDSVPSGG